VRDAWLFISDLHLSAETPESLQAFVAFLEGPVREARGLYILGDLFEYWAGDDDWDSPGNREVTEALSAAASRTAVHFMPGNRDLLVGSAYAARTGLRLLEDPSVLESGGLRLLLMHGDTLCTDDQAYQQYRAQVHDPRYQAAFLARPLAERRAFIAGLRSKSEQAKRDKAMDIMDVNQDAVAQTLRQHAYPVLVHGHTHRPARHEHLVDGHACTRWVLPDWRGVAAYLQLAEGKLTAHGFLPTRR
jgi:UDP-2,3-diacylglucosamine hydrolase